MNREPAGGRHLCGRSPAESDQGRLWAGVDGAGSGHRGAHRSGREISAEIDRLMNSATPERFRTEMERLKAEIDQVNMSTVCDKRELNVEFSGPKLRLRRGSAHAGRRYARR